MGVLSIKLIKYTLQNPVPLRNYGAQISELDFGFTSWHLQRWNIIVIIECKLLLDVLGEHPGSKQQIPPRKLHPYSNFIYTFHQVKHCILGWEYELTYPQTIHWTRLGCQGFQRSQSVGISTPFVHSHSRQYIFSSSLQINILADQHFYIKLTFLRFSGPLCLLWRPTILQCNQLIQMLEVYLHSCMCSNGDECQGTNRYQV